MAAMTPVLAIGLTSTHKLRFIDNSGVVTDSTTTFGTSEMAFGLAFDAGNSIGVMLAYSPDGLRLMRSTDAGMTWTQVTGTLATNLDAYQYNLGMPLAFGNGRFMIICPNAGNTLLQAWTSTDGATWTVAGTIFAIGSLSTWTPFLMFTERGYWYVSDWYNDTGDGWRKLAWVSSNDGANWGELTSELQYEGEGICFSCSNDGGVTLLTDYEGVIWKHTTGTGHVLTKALANFYTSYPTETGAIVDILWRSGTWFLLCCDYGENGRIWTSTDDGATWALLSAAGVVNPYEFYPLGARHTLSPTTGRMTILNYDSWTVLSVKTSADSGATWDSITALETHPKPMMLWMHPSFTYTGPPSGDFWSGFVKTIEVVE